VPDVGATRGRTLELSNEFAADDRPGHAGNGSNGSNARPVDLPEPERVDLLEADGTQVLRRVVPVVGALVVLLVVVGLLRRRRKG
jgi:hypothetical protein